MTSDCSHMSCKQLFKYTKCNYLYTSVKTSGSHSTPLGADGKFYSNKMPVSHKEITVPQTELEGSDTGQLGPSNSSGLLNRLYSHPTSVTPASPITLSQDKHALVTQKVQELLFKGAIVETIPSPVSFVSQIFLVKKKGGGGDNDQ